MIYVDSLNEGIVIDHIRAGAGFDIFFQLGLDKIDSVVLLMRNVPSEKMGRKDLIKVESNFELNLDILGLIDPNVTINIIQDGKIMKKFKLELPAAVSGILKCKNPRCISHREEIADSMFYLYDEQKRYYKCEYCDSVTWL
ncbi:MAG: aspartate carbamoyltransferase regulatory subunit [Eubacteriaceae bacterium]|nr:aspartate carbamoyltransferase regulatory subunit [Eubacteriaceae bacterium]